MLAFIIALLLPVLVPIVLADQPQPPFFEVGDVTQSIDARIHFTTNPEGANLSAAIIASEVAYPGIMATKVICMDPKDTHKPWGVFLVIEIRRGSGKRYDYECWKTPLPTNEEAARWSQTFAWPAFIAQAMNKGVRVKDKNNYQKSTKPNSVKGYLAALHGLNTTVSYDLKSLKPFSRNTGNIVVLETKDHTTTLNASCPYAVAELNGDEFSLIHPASAYPEAVYKRDAVQADFHAYYQSLNNTL